MGKWKRGWRRLDERVEMRAYRARYELMYTRATETSVNMQSLVEEMRTLCEIEVERNEDEVCRHRHVLPYVINDVSGQSRVEVHSQRQFQV